MNRKEEIKYGSIFSEISRYIFLDKNDNSYRFKHLETNTTVTLAESYVTDLLESADQFTSTVKVTKEDSRDGTKKGIRSLFEEIYDGQVFTVCFRKQDTPHTIKKLKELKEAQITQALAKIEATAKAKKGVTEEAKKVLQDIQNNPILPFEEGEERVLRGYKVQFTSRDGKYNCVDMDLVEGNDINKAIRPVNINSLIYLVYKGVKYVVE